MLSSTDSNQRCRRCQRQTMMIILYSNIGPHIFISQKEESELTSLSNEENSLKVEESKHFQRNTEHTTLLDNKTKEKQRKKPNKRLYKENSPTSDQLPPEDISIHHQTESLSVKTVKTSDIDTSHLQNINDISREKVKRQPT